MCTSPACPNWDTAFLYRHLSQRRTMSFIQCSKLLWISTCSSFLLKIRHLLSFSVCPWLQFPASCQVLVVLIPVLMFVTSFFIISQWTDWTERKFFHFVYIYALWFGKLKSIFFPPKIARITFKPYGFKTLYSSLGSRGVPGSLKWIIGAGFSGSKKLCGFGAQRWLGVRDAVWYKQWNIQAALEHPEGVA